jgi:hypothetical protein
MDLYECGENLRQSKGSLISPRNGKDVTGLKPGIFAVSKRKPTFSERSATHTRFDALRLVSSMTMAPRRMQTSRGEAREVQPQRPC